MPRPSPRIDLSREELTLLARGEVPDALRRTARRELEDGRMADALVHIRRARAAAGEPDTAIPVHRATQVRQNLRFAADLLAPDVPDEAIIIGRGMRVRLPDSPGDVRPQPLPSSMPDKAPASVLPTEGRRPDDDGIELERE